MIECMMSFLLCFLAHEGGHFLAALCFGKRLKFRFAWGKYYVPRYIWSMPHMERWKQRVVAAAGFGAEGAVAGALCWAGWPWMAGAFVVHLAAYPFYAGAASDWKWFL